MEHNTPQKNMRERLEEMIDSRELSMRPKIYFTLKVAAMVLVALAVLFISIFIFNFILFSVRVSEHESLLGFGPRGLYAFFMFFPWWLLALDVALIAALEWLLRSFRIGSKIPVLYLLVGIVLLTSLTALAVDRGTGFNDQLLDRADHHGLPKPINDFYGGARHHAPPEEGVCKCIVVAIDGPKLTLQDTQSTTTIVVILPPNDPRATTTSLQVGDIVFVAGDIEGDMIRAFGLRKLPK